MINLAGFIKVYNPCIVAFCHVLSVRGRRLVRVKQELRQDSVFGFYRPTIVVKINVLIKHAIVALWSGRSERLR
jgi:hypothetical protein